MTIERPMFPRANAPATPPAILTTRRTSYLDLEPLVLDLDRMAQIAFTLAQSLNDSTDEYDLVLFVIHRFHEMSAHLRKAYESGLDAGGEG